MMQNMTMGRFSLKSRFYASLLLSIFIFILTLVIDKTHIYFLNYITFLVATVVIFGCGSFFFTNMWQGLKKCQFNMFTLICLSVFSGYIYSCYHLFLMKSGHLYFDSACYITSLILWSHLIEMTARMQMQMKKGFLIDNLNKMQEKIDKIAGFFVIFTIIVAIIAGGIWYCYASFSVGFSVFMAVLLGACPCALTLATPVCAKIVADKMMQKSLNMAKIAPILQQKIAQNIKIGVIYNMIIIPIAGGVLYPVCGFLLSPVMAAVLMSLSSVAIIYNSNRLKRNI